MSRRIQSSKLSMEEANCLWTAYRRRTESMNSLECDSQGMEKCSHNYDKEVLYRNNIYMVVREPATPFTFIRLLKEIETKIRKVAKKEAHEVSEFQYCTSDMQCSGKCLWYATLLIDWHEVTECRQFMSLAIKLFLKLYNCSGRYLGGERLKLSEAVIVLKKHLQLLSLYKCNFSLIQAFWHHLIFHYEHYLIDGNKEFFSVFITYICECSLQLGLNVQTFFSGSFKYEKLITNSLYDNFQLFFVITKYGYENKKITGVACNKLFKLYQSRVNHLGRCNLFDFSVKNRRITLDTPFAYRSVQALYFYIKFVNLKRDSSKSMLVEMFKLLWNTISDSFLTKTQFVSSLRTERQIVLLDLDAAWNFYEESVKLDQHPVRCLLHLSRVSIRRRLTLCAQLPYGVEFLELPTILKKYLRLEDTAIYQFVSADRSEISWNTQETISD